MSESLSIQPIYESDLEQICDYWYGLNEKQMKAMGADISKLPEREDLFKSLKAQLDKPIKERRSYGVIWLADKKAIGHANTNPTIYGKDAFMHLHLWDPEQRAKGSGTALVKMTADHFIQTLKLERLYCEPYALNEAPNKLLEKTGFTLEKEYVTTPGNLNFEQPVKRWVRTGNA